MKLRALFGGTFDPIHNAHLTVATEAAGAFGLDEVLFIPAGNPPHKADSTTASYQDRFRMVELACASDPRFVASRLEEGEGRSYSINTIEKLWSPDRALYFIIGADAFADIETWHRWNDVIRLTDFIVVTRPGHDYGAPAQARVHRLDTLALPVSSSDIRSKLALGEIPAELPREVAQFIVERG
ncbi:MAG: nicotinate-nucleotide adenylyltransferase, partial [Acidobacteriota bacterium]|nr:nicotinate-nucleotide adenylyltransferase [Acidobacteriota bacterium]